MKLPLLAAVLFGGVLYTADAIDPVLVGQWPGYIRGNPVAVAVRNNVAYTAVGDGGVLAVDLGNGSVIGSLRTCAPAMDVQVNDHFLFISTRGAGLQIADIADESHPVQIAAYGGNATVTSFYAAGTVAAISVRRDGFAGLELIGIGNPAAPQYLGGYAATNIYRALISQNVAVLANSTDGIETVDISDPTRPMPLSLRVSTSGPAAALAVNGDTLFVAFEKDFRFSTAPVGGVETFDISNPKSPRALGKFTGADSGATDLKYRDGRVYLAAGHFGLEILDVRDPRYPSLLGGGDAVDNSVALGVALSGNLALLCIGNSLQLTDVSNPAHPKLAGSVQTIGGTANDVAIAGDLAFVSDFDSGLRVVDVSNRTNPREVGRYTPPRYFYAVAAANNLAVLSGYTFNYLQLVDVRNPASPFLIRTDAVPATQVTVQGNLLYVSAGSSGLMVIDIANPSQPATIARLQLTGGPGVVTVGTHYAYAAWGGPNFTGGFDVIDISNPYKPFRVGTFSAATPAPGMDSEAAGIALSGSTVLLACSDSGLQLVDVSNPSAPKLIRTYYLDGKPSASTYISKVAVNGNLACVAALGRGIQLIDISNPAKPFRVADYNVRPLCADSLDLTGYALSVRIVNDTLFVANSDYGLLILDIGKLSTPALRITRSVPPAIELSGYPGRNYKLESASAISATTDWAQVSSIVLTNNPQSLPISDYGPQMFYRAVLVP